MRDGTQPEENQTHCGHPHVCPWWFCFSFDNVARKLFHDPQRILKPYVMPGWTVLDVGPGMGYFTITLARLVGESGKVIAADLQQKMLEGVDRRAAKVGVRDRIVLLRSQPDRIGIGEAIDFCLVFWMAHEVAHQGRFFTEISSSLKPGGLLLLVEPKLHVSRKSFDNTLRIALSTGLSQSGQPRVSASHTALLQRLADRQPPPGLAEGASARVSPP